VLYNITTNSALAEVLLPHNQTVKLHFPLPDTPQHNNFLDGHLPEGTKLGLLIRGLSSIKQISCISVKGHVEVSEKRLELWKTTTFDLNLKIQYVTNQPLDNFKPAPHLQPQFPENPTNLPVPYGFIPWSSNTLPWKANLPSKPPGSFYPIPGNYYSKFQSVQYSVFFYLDIDMFTIPSNSPELTIFIKNFQDRGYQNYLKKVYMSALTSDKMQYYEAKIDTMLNVAFTKFTVNQEPVVSAFKDVLIKFFLDIHIGHDIYPDYVIEYFRNFIDVVGFGDPNRPGRNEIMLRGNQLAPSVKAYFRQRNDIVVATNDKTSIAYYWNLAGLPIESLLIECVHNIVAFSQYNNTLYRLIADKLWAGTDPSAPRNVYGFPPLSPNPPNGQPSSPTNHYGGPPNNRGNVPEWYPYPPINQLALPIPGFPTAGPVDFFAKLLAVNDPDPKIAAAFRLNVVREAYRLLSPNTNAFSKLETGNPTDPPTQCRHIWQQISILNTPLPPNIPPQAQGLAKAILFFKYDTSRYANFETSVLNYTPAPAPVPPTIPSFNPADLFTVSPTDNNPAYDDGTVLEKDNPKLFPVFDSPLYLPFGPGYRRCAGETLNYFFTEKMITRFASLKFKVMPLDVIDYTKYQTVGPFTAVPNNIYVDLS
jgi:hypothetical protein